MSRLSEILKVEEMQEFTYKDGAKMRVNCNLLEWFSEVSKDWVSLRRIEILFDIIAHSDLIKPIVSKPELTEQQITVIKGRIAEGTPWVAKDKYFSCIWFYSNKPIDDSGVFKCTEEGSRQTICASDLYSFVSYENSPIYLPDLIEEE